MLGGFGIPKRASGPEWVNFRGGIDDVIYPGETLKITKLIQHGQRKTGTIDVAPVSVNSSGASKDRWFFRSVKFSYDISCEGIPTLEGEEYIPEASAVITVIS